MRKKIGLLLIILIIILYPGLSAMDIEINADYITCSAISAYSPRLYIVMDNNDFMRHNISLPLRFYSPDSSITQVYYTSNGGIILSNGFDEGGFWNLTNEVVKYDWDGVLPESFCFIGESDQTAGWPSDLGEKTYITIDFQIVEAWKNCRYGCQICIDTFEIEGQYEWLFEEPIPDWLGPYCWQVIAMPNEDPIQFYNCPYSYSLTSAYNHSMSYTFQADHIMSDPVNFEFISGPGEIVSQAMGIATWQFYPDISDAGCKYSSVIRAYDYCVPAVTQDCEFIVEIASAAGDVNADMSVILLDALAIINYLYKGGPPPVHFYHADVYGSGILNLLDALQIIKYLYNGEEVGQRNIKDDIPLRPGSYCKYERFRRDEGITDTVTVSVTNYETLRYRYPDSTEYKHFDIVNEMVYIGNYAPVDFVYDMPILVGESWIIEDTGYVIHDTVTAIQAIDDLPVGHIEDAYQIIRTTTIEGIEITSTYREEWFAPGYGMVKLYIWDSEVPTIPYDESWELIEYNAVK